jgi:hypothetical protein
MPRYFEMRGHSEEETKEAALHASRDRRNRRIRTHIWREIPSGCSFGIGTADKMTATFRDLVSFR